MNKYLSKTHKSSGFISLIGVLGLVAIVLLATSLYFYMKKDNTVTPITATSTDDIIDTTRYAQKCGLTITFPTIGTTASFPLPLKGIIDNRNRNALGCSWTVFEAQAGTARVFANINNQGWKEVGYWGDNQSGAIAGPVPMMTVGDWMTENPVSVSATLMLDPKAGVIPAGTPMKIVINEEDPSGMGGETLEVPFVYSGENVEMTRLTIHKPIDDHPTDCGQTYTEVRYVPKTTAVADAALRLLLNENYPSLKDHYNGVTIRSGVAIVDFDQPALSRLNSPACMQTMTKTPIEKTLKEFPTIKSVEYSIDGEVFDEWDA
jgi:hypothetical protein